MSVSLSSLRAIQAIAAFLASVILQRTYSLFPRGTGNLKSPHTNNSANIPSEGGELIWLDPGVDNALIKIPDLSLLMISFMNRQKNLQESILILLKKPSVNFAADQTGILTVLLILMKMTFILKETILFQTSGKFILPA